MWSDLDMCDDLLEYGNVLTYSSRSSSDNDDNDDLYRDMLLKLVLVSAEKQKKMMLNKFAIIN